MLTVHTNQLNTVIKFFQLCAYIYTYDTCELKSPNREREKGKYFFKKVLYDTYKNKSLAKEEMKKYF